MPDPSAPPPVPAPNRRSRWVAIVTGALSILIGLLYLGLVTVLDRSGPLLPPPPEALGAAPAAGSQPVGRPASAAAAPGSAAGAPPPAAAPL